MTQLAWKNFDVGDWSPRRTMPVSLLKQVIERHAPVIHFHPEEVYFPSTIDWYLARALLIDQSTGAVILKHPKSEDLPEGPADPSKPEAMWLTLDPEIAGPELEPELTAPDDPRRGDLASAKAYVRAVHHPKLGATDLQFWMFYPYDGPGLVRLRPFAFGARRADRLLSLWPGGMHEADWELAVIRIDHQTLAPRAVYLSQHKGGDAHLGEEEMDKLERDGDGRIQLYASLYGHATYARPDERKLFYLWRSVKLFGLEMALVDQASRHTSWNLGDPDNHLLFSASWNEPELPEPAWVRYGWRWGRYEPKGGRFTRKFVDEVTTLLETRMATLTLILHVVTVGLFALFLALASWLLSGKRGSALLGELADNSGPRGPRWQQHKWHALYGFTAPPAAKDWRPEGESLAHRIAETTDGICRPPVRLLGSALRWLFGPILPKT